jgi:hypothetical protein
MRARREEESPAWSTRSFTHNSSAVVITASSERTFTAKLLPTRSGSTWGMTMIYDSQSWTWKIVPLTFANGSRKRLNTFLRKYLQCKTIVIKPMDWSDDHKTTCFCSWKFADRNASKPARCKLVSHDVYIWRVLISDFPFVLFCCMFLLNGQGEACQPCLPYLRRSSSSSVTP